LVCCHCKQTDPPSPWAGTVAPPWSLPSQPFGGTIKATALGAEPQHQKTQEPKQALFRSVVGYKLGHRPQKAIILSLHGNIKLDMYNLKT